MMIIINTDNPITITATMTIIITGATLLSLVSSADSILLFVPLSIKHKISYI